LFQGSLSWKMYTRDGRLQCGETRSKYYDYQTAKKVYKTVVYDLLISFGQSLMLFRMSYLKNKNSHYSKIIKSSHRHCLRSWIKCAHYLIDNLLLKIFSYQNVAHLLLFPLIWIQSSSNICGKNNSIRNIVRKKSSNRNRLLLIVICTVSL